MSTTNPRHVHTVTMHMLNTGLILIWKHSIHHSSGVPLDIPIYLFIE